MYSPTRLSVDAIDAMARQIVTDHLTTRFKSEAAWSRPGQGDIPQVDADAIVDRANTLMSAVADAFAKSVEPARFTTGQELIWFSAPLYSDRGHWSIVSFLRYPNGSTTLAEVITSQGNAIVPIAQLTAR